MIDELTAIHAYLAPPAGSFWKWSDDGEVIDWVDNRTIAFRAELLVVLNLQASRGLPPLSPVVLLLAASREAWTESSRNAGILHGLIEQLLAFSRTPVSEIDNARRMIGHGLSQLGRVRSALSNFRNDLHAKAVLVDVVFETVTERTSPETASRILEALAEGPLRPGQGPPLKSHQFLSDLRMVYPGVRRLDAELLRMRMHTGLDTELLPTEDVELPLGQKIRKLFSELEDDEELAGVARLARNLMAVAHLPRPLDDRDDMPVGGVSDISNRGTLDRLLISELAQDDETLMLRVAMNEALYLRRETPPRNPPRSRVIVIDSGLRLWGTPRVFATSVAMSLAAMSDPGVELIALRPEGGRFAGVDLSTREGLVEHLKSLRPEAHPGASLPELKRYIEECPGETDIALITGADVVADPEFQRDLIDCEEQIEFLMTVARSGEFQLTQRLPHGTKLLRSATLDLDRLLAPAPRPAVPLIDPELSAELPAILRLKPFPLRLPHHVVPQQTWSVGPQGVLSVTNDRRLMHWELTRIDGNLLAARQIGEGLPSRQVLWRSGVCEEGVTRFVVGNRGTAELWLVTADLVRQRCRVTPLATGRTPVLCVTDHAGVLFVIHKRKVDVCSQWNGELIQTLEYDRYCNWCHARYFIIPTGWLALSYDGTTARFEQIVDYHRDCADVGLIITMFDIEGVQGPVGLTQRGGSLYFPTERKTSPVNPRIPEIRAIRAISQDGGRICVDAFDTDVPLMINTGSKQVTPVYGDLYMTLENPVLSAIYSQTVRSRITAVGAVGHWLILQTRRNRLLWLLRDSQHDRLILTERIDAKEIRTGLKPFRNKTLPDPAPRGMKSAVWNDGSEVFLDPRGMLHLRSGDSSIPEVTLILFDEHVAGWCADGRMWGTPYFLGERAGVSPAEIWNDVICPFASRLTT